MSRVSYKHGYIADAIAVFLAASHHGRGIASDAINTLLHDWLVPRMGVRRVLAFPFVGNHGGVKVFLKNEFRFLFGCENHAVVRGMARSINVVEWRLDSDSDSGRDL